MVPKLNPIKVQKIIKEKRVELFSPLEFQRIFGVSYDAARKFLFRYSKKGFITKLRAGLYALTDNMPSQYLIANKLYEPSYISFDTALSFHGIIPETIYTITSAASMARRKFKVLNTLFTYQKIKKEFYTGYKPIKYLGETILMAEPEKALADYLYFVDLKKRRPEYERIDLLKIKKSKLISYAKLFKRSGMIDLIDQIYADFRKPKRIY